MIHFLPIKQPFNKFLIDSPAEIGTLKCQALSR